MRLVLTGCVFILFTACSSIKPYEKEYLLDPLMSDEQLSHLNSSFFRAATAEQEHLSSGAAGTSGGSSCPTCGG
jgi:hypothetical protein